MQVILTSAFIFFLVLIGFGQCPQSFREKNANLTREFSSAHEMTDEVISVRKYELTRSEGFLIKDMITSSSLYTQYINKSGNVIFNSEAGDYLNEIKNLLLNDYPHVQKVIQVYITKDEALNAFATANNKIYVNIGLLASLENEAQLAYILSHEIMHIVNNHIVNQTLEVIREETTFNKSDLLLNSEIIQLHKHTISRKNETEADVDGFDLFSRLYPVSEALSALKKLETPSSYDTIRTSSHFFLADSLVYSKISSCLSNPDLVKREKKNLADSVIYLTHPLIKDRIAKLILIIEGSSLQLNDSNKFVLSEEKFRKLNQSAKIMLPELLANNLDFVQLFIRSAHAYHFENDSTEKNLEYLGFSIQGLCIDKLNNQKYPHVARTGNADSLLYYFSKYSTHKEFLSWCYNAISRLELENPSNSKLKSYKMALIQNIQKHDTLLAMELFPDRTNEVTNSESKIEVVLKNIDFDISPYINITRKQKKSFNQFDGKKRDQGKTAIVNMINFRLIITASQRVKNYPIDNERLNERAYKASLNLEKDYPDDLLSVVPNNVDYSSTDYELYVALNRWLFLNQYFEGYFFVDPNKKYLDSLTGEKNISHCMSTINIEIKSFNFNQGALFWLSMIPMPHYIPQSLSNVFLGSTRKYKLTMIYHIPTGNLVFWDKQTSLEPSTTAQFYFLYRNIISNYLEQ